MPFKVLIVDDALFMRNMLKEIFLRAGYEIAGEAGDGEAAVEAFRRVRPDLVTMDIVMPRMNGIEALREITSLDSEARVVMCSALGQEHLVLQAVEAGARDFIIKPFKEEQVLKVVRRLTRK